VPTVESWLDGLDSGEYGTEGQRMNVTVKFVSPLNRSAGTDQTSVSLPEGARLAELVGALREGFPRLFPAAERAIYMVDTTLAHQETALRDGGRVLMMQVLGGG